MSSLPSAAVNLISTLVIPKPCSVVSFDTSPLPVTKESRVIVVNPETVFIFTFELLKSSLTSILYVFVF